uniref:AP-5 complex subunit mu-1 n=1 Tax=Cyprinus carpio carpio TaxID=630221 RepID=A0A8C1FVS8_CYPCA
MSIRALWVVSQEKGEPGKLGIFPETVLHATSCRMHTHGQDRPKPYVEVRDDYARQHRSPAVELRLDGPGGRTLWPLLTVTQGALILACLPLVEAPPEPRPPLPSLASVSQGLALLSGLQDFLCGPGGKPEPDVLASRLAALPSVLLQVCPLGRPLDTPPPAGSVPAAVAPSPGGAQKQPAWKAGVHRGRAVVSVALTEKVRSMQYGKSSVLPNVTVTLTLPPNGSPLQDILVHPCVTSLDASILTACSVDENDCSAFSGPYKFPFSPPLELFRLCSYTSQVPVPPILGSYQLKAEENHLKANVVLKLHESVKNSFEYCEAHIPFFNQNLMGSVEVKVSSGQLEVSKEKSLLVWVLGQKFPKSREAALEGTVHFSGTVAGPTDPLCTGLTAYIKLYFRVADLTLSGCCVDQHSVQVYSSAKPRIVTTRELVSSEYYIWNSTGDAPVSSGAVTASH